MTEPTSIRDEAAAALHHLERLAELLSRDPRLDAIIEAHKAIRQIKSDADVAYRKAFAAAHGA